MENDYFLPLHQTFVGKSSEEIITFLVEKGLLNKDGLERREELIKRMEQLGLPTVAEKKNTEEIEKLKYFRQNVGLFKTEIIFYYQTKDKKILTKETFWRNYRKAGFDSVKRISDSDQYKSEIEQYQKLNIYHSKSLTNEENQILNEIIRCSTQVVPGENWNVFNHRQNTPQQMAKILLPYLTEKGQKLELGNGEYFESWKKEFESEKILKQQKIEEPSQNNKTHFLWKWWQFWKWF